MLEKVYKAVKKLVEGLGFGASVQLVPANENAGVDAHVLLDGWVFIHEDEVKVEIPSILTTGKKAKYAKRKAKGFVVAHEVYFSGTYWEPPETDVVEDTTTTNFLTAASTAVNIIYENKIRNLLGVLEFDAELLEDEEVI